MLQKINLYQRLISAFVQYIHPLLTLAILLSVLPDWEPRGHWYILFVFSLLTIIGAFAPVSTYNARLTINNAVFFSGILLYGTWVAVWAAVVELLIVTFLFRSSLKKILFNSGQILVSIWVVGSLHELLMQYSIPWMITDLLLVVVYWFTNTCLVATGISYFFRAKWVSTFNSMMKGGTSTYIMLLIIGGIGARLVSAFGILSLIPLAAAFCTIGIVFRQYYDGLNQLEQKVEEIKSLNHSFLIAMAASIDARDHYTSGHSQRVAYWGKEIAKAMQLPQEKVNEVYFGGILHDIGKIGIEDDILNKDGKLTPEEFNRIKQHTVIGHEIVKQAGVFQELLPAIRSHHERIDGRGYPDGLSGEEIPIVARILAVSDAFDAMVSDRPYRQGLPVEKAIEQINEGAGSQFDDKIAALFVEMIMSIPHEELIAIIQQASQKTNHPYLKEAF